jgi:hypothetical protein
MLNILRTAERTRFAFVGVFAIFFIRLEISARVTSATLIWPRWGDDVEPAVAKVGLDRRGLIARLGVVGDEALEELFHCGRLARGTLLCTRILTFADVGQPVLGNGTGLLDSDLAKAPDGWFAALAVVGDIGHPEDLRPVGVTLSRKPGIAASRSS